MNGKKNTLLKYIARSIEYSFPIKTKFLSETAVISIYLFIFSLTFAITENSAMRIFQ